MKGAILAIRAEPGLSQTIDRAAQIGLLVTGVPLFDVHGVPWSLPEDLAFDGILLGSANAIRYGGAKLANLLDLPVYAVGNSTAEMARQAGFPVERIGKGGLQALIDDIHGAKTRLLRLTAQDRIDLIPPPNVQIVESVVYESIALPAPPKLKELLCEGGIVMLHSARAAEHLASELSRIAVEKSTIRLAVMGARIAAAAGEGWAEIGVAEHPDDGALLALIANMCK